MGGRYTLLRNGIYPAIGMRLWPCELATLVRQEQEAGARGGTPAGGLGEAAGASEGSEAAGEGEGGAQPGPLGLGECGTLLGELEAPGAVQGKYERAGGEVGPGV